MLNVVGTIIGQHYTLIGLVIEGDAADFNEIGAKVQRAVSLPVACELIKAAGCKNFTVRRDRLVAKGKAQLSDLPMYLENMQKLATNSMTLTAKVVSDDTIIGFSVLLDGLGITNNY